MASATLNVTLSISSTDLFDSVNLAKTVTDALTIDGDNRQGLTVVKNCSRRRLIFNCRKFSRFYWRY